MTENFKINSGNSATKRKQEAAISYNYKSQMIPHSLDFSSPVHSPIQTKRRILGELQNFKPNSPIIERLKNSPLEFTVHKTPLMISNVKSPTQFKSPLSNMKSPINNIKSPINYMKSPLQVQSQLHKAQSPLNNKKSPLETLKSPRPCLNSPILTTHSPLTSRLKQQTKISRIFEDRTRFKMSHPNKENMENLSLDNETYMKLDLEEDARDCSFGSTFPSNRERVEEWSNTKLDFTDTLPSKSFEDQVLVLEKEQDMDDLESLQDLEAEFENDNFEQCNYEIISTDSPDIISQGRASTSRKINARNFDFGAPIAANEQSTSFNRPATRMLNFDDDDFEFTSPAVKKTVSVKKSLKFDLTPTKHTLKHEKSDSSIGSMSLSPSSTHLHRVFTSESTTSMESGFISELEEPFLEIEESNSPKIANFNELLIGQIKENPMMDRGFLKRPTLGRSLSLHPESKAKVSLLSILESPEKRIQKRTERGAEEENLTKRRRSNCDLFETVQRPVLQRAYSENNASIMSALARSSTEPDLIGDFSQPFSLPLTSGDHSDLKSISCETLAGLLRGQYQDIVAGYQVIDCRYPYEFEGGHITGAVNLYTGAQLVERLGGGTAGGEKLVEGLDGGAAGGERLVQELGGGAAVASRRVLVFHCEYSLQRGPTLSRYLRSADREKNKENYPFLDYPEVYLLHEGYRAFYQRYPELCTPRGYTAMLDPKHRHLLRKHRSFSEPGKSVRRNRLHL